MCIIILIPDTFATTSRRAERRRRLGPDRGRDGLLEEVIRIDTTNPPGNETPAATVLARKLSEDGIGAEVLVIPAEMGACRRLLPGEDPTQFLAVLHTVIADDAVEAKPFLSFPASSSDSASAFMAAVRDLARPHLGGARSCRASSPGFADSHYFRARGIASYGFVPFVLPEQEEKTVHGTDERVPLENLRDGVERLVALLRALP